MQSQGRIARNREIVLAVAVTVGIVLLRIAIGLQLHFCGTPDSCAYLSLGQSLSQHHGFQQNFLYQYQFVDHHLPTHGIEYWRPGVSLLLLLTAPFAAVTVHSGMILATLAGVLLALAAWKIAMATTGDRRVACTAYLLCLVLAPLWDGSLVPDSGLFYGLFAAWFLALFTVRSQGYLADLAALLCVAGVNLIRNDTILLFPSLLVVLWLRHRSRKHDAAATRGTSIAYAALMIVGFFAAMLPMALIDHAVLGTFSSGSTTHVLYLNDLSDLGRYGQPLTLHTALATGVGKLIKLRIAVLPLVIYRIVFLQIGFAAVFLTALLRRHSSEPRIPMPEWAGGGAFAVSIVAVYGIVLPAVGVFSALRSEVGLTPLLAVTIVLSSAAIVRPETLWKSTHLALLAAVIAFYLVSGIMDDRRSITTQNEIADTDSKAAAFLQQHQVTPTSHTLIMTADPAQFSVTTGYPAVPIPTNGIDAAAAAANDLHVTEVVVPYSQWTDAEMQSSFHPSSMQKIPDTSLIVLTLHHSY